MATPRSLSESVSDDNDWDLFFRTSKVPETFEEGRGKIVDFVNKHLEGGRGVVLVSSGGTTVPLESRTIRFIDNFSVGTRGATSAEHFMRQGYAVIFLHRKGSLEPFKRHFMHINFLDLLNFKSESGEISVCDEHKDQVSRILREYQKVSAQDLLLSQKFTSLPEYLYMLREMSKILKMGQRKVMFYLAAAVSDFYIPADEMPEHKIQSSSGPLQLHLQLVPKMLQPMVMEWAPDAFIVSFKLETDLDLLLPKARGALKKYRHQVVIGNILETRKREVLLVLAEEETKIIMTDEEMKSGREIEEKIISKLIEIHQKYKTS